MFLLWLTWIATVVERGFKSTVDNGPCPPVNVLVHRQVTKLLTAPLAVLAILSNNFRQLPPPRRIILVQDVFMRAMFILERCHFLPFDLTRDLSDSCRDLTRRHQLWSVFYVYVAAGSYRWRASQGPVALRRYLLRIVLPV